MHTYCTYQFIQIFKTEILQSVSAEKFPRAKKILWYIKTKLRSRKKNSWRSSIEILRIYPAIWQNLAESWPQSVKNGKNWQKKCRVWKFSRDQMRWNGTRQDKSWNLSIHHFIEICDSPGLSSTKDWDVSERRKMILSRLGAQARLWKWLISICAVILW